MSRLLAPVRRIPADIVPVLGAVAAAVGATWLGSGSPIRLAVMLTFLLFVPGYALTTAIFPAKLTSDRRQHRHPLGPARGAALDGVERAAVSFGLSLVLLPLFGLTLAVLSWSFTPWLIVTLLGAFVGVVMVIGVIRRAMLPREARYDLPIGRWIHGIRENLGRGPATDTMLNVALALAVMTAAAALTVAVVAPQDGSAYTELTLLTFTDDDDLVAADYPTDFSRGQGEPLVLEVTNHEDRTMDYTVVVKLERLDGDRVTESDQLDQFDKQIPAEGTWQIQHTVTPSIVGDDLRLIYLLYEGDPPENPHEGNAYQHVYLWIDVSE